MKGADYITAITPPNIFQNHIRIPREIIYGTTIGEKRASCYAYFFTHMTDNNTVLFSYDYLIRWCGFTPDRKKNRKTGLSMKDKFSQVITWLCENQYISNFNERSFWGNNLQYCLINRDKFGDNKQFSIIYDFEINLLQHYDSNYRPLTKSTILLVLAYIRVNMWRRTTQLTVELDAAKKKKPEIVSRQYRKIAEDIGISERLVSRAISVLNDMGIIVARTLPRFQDESGKWHTEDTIFANKYRYLYNNRKKQYELDKNYDCEKELQYGVKFLQERKYSNKKFNQK